MAAAKSILDLLMAGGRNALKTVYDKKYDQMMLKPDKRVQPDPSRTPFIDADYQTPAPVTFSEDLGAMYPRNPNPFAPLPKRDRSRSLVENRPAIAKALADRIRQSDVLEGDARYFYHSDGPLYRAAKRAGLSDAEAKSYLDDFSSRFAATSPRTKVEPNILNATNVMAKEQAGIPFREVVGRGSGGTAPNEKGYGMMVNEGGIHGILLDDIEKYGTIDRATNTKPATFGANMVGNRSGVTVDTHAIRGALMTMNKMDAGSVPEGFILPKFVEQYRKDPTTLTPNMIDDTVGKQVIEVDGRKVNAQTEYPVFADIYHDVAEELGVSPAEAQALGWFGLGDETNLGSASKTVSDVFDERLDVTAKNLGITTPEAARLVFNRKIPLMGAAGAGLLAAQQSDRQAVPSDDILNYLAGGS